MILDIVVLFVVLYLVSKRRDDFQISQVFFATLGIEIGHLLIIKMLGPYIGGFSLVIVFLFSVYILVRFCSVTFKEGAIVMTIFTLYEVTLGLVL